MAAPHRYVLAVCLLVLLAGAALAGGGPQDVLVIANSRSRESLEVANLYRRARDLPYRQVLVLAVSPAPVVSYQAYLDDIEQPIRDYLRAQQMEDDITCLVLTRGLPMQVDVQNGRSVASLLAAMHLGKGSARTANPYQGAAFAFSRGQDALRGMYLVTVLNGYHTRDVATLIAQGLRADGSAPDGRFILQSALQLSRASNASAAELLMLRGLKTETPGTPPADRGELMGYFSGGIYSGLTRDMLAASTFRPGAIVDYVQQYGAAPRNFSDSEAPVLLPVSAFVQAGAAGVHGVIGEAGAGTFPMTANLKLLLDRYTSGFSLAESFYAALPVLNWQNVVVGDPLCAPYAKRPTVLIDVDADEPLAGTVPVRVAATSHTPGTAINRIDLYLDDRFVQTLYEPPAATISLRIGDRIVAYTLPRGASLQQALDGMAQAINSEKALGGPAGVRAVPLASSGTLQLLSRMPGTGGNGIPVAVTVEADGRQPAPITASIGQGKLDNGGEAPSPARGTLSFVGRRLKPGDRVTIQIQTERITCVAPEGMTKLPALLDELVARIEASPTLQARTGVRAYRDPAGMPFITLEARKPGEAGNQIPYQLAVTPVEGSQLRGYPDTPAHLTGGQDGSNARLDLRFSLGETSPLAAWALNTTMLGDGTHRLRAVAYDESAAQVQGYALRTITVRNRDNAPVVSLPPALGPASGQIEVPVAAGEQVVRVELYLDGRLVAAENAPPFTMRVSLAEFGRGPHDLWAVGCGADGARYISPVSTLQVLTPPEITRIEPASAASAGNVVHRIIGTGFQPGCSVRLHGVPARAVTVRSPNLLEVVSDAGPVGRGAVEVANPDAQWAALHDAFEYYTPRIARVKVLPPHDVMPPGGTTRFVAQSLDQFGRPIEAKLAWDVLGGGSIDDAGAYRAPTEPGTAFLVRAITPDGQEAARATVTVGAEELPRDGWLRQWLVLGAFPDPEYRGLLTALIDERLSEPSRAETVGELAWRSLYAEKHFVDFASALTPNTGAVAYAHLYLHAPGATTGSLVFGANDGVRVWLNGEQIFTQRVRRTAASPDQYSLNVSLRAGWNRLLVKVDQESGGWGFYMRLLGRGGKPLNDITFALDRPADMPE